MSEPLSTAQQQELIRDLARTVSQRAQTEEDVATRFARDSEKVETDYQAARQAIESQYAADQARLTQEYETAKRTHMARAKSEYNATREEYERQKEDITKRADSGAATAKKKKQEARWEASTIFDATKDRPKQQLASLRKQLVIIGQEFDGQQSQSQRVLKERKVVAPPPLEPTATEAPAKDVAALGESLVAAKRALRDLSQQKLPALFQAGRHILLAIALGIAVGAPLGIWVGFDHWLWPAVAVTVAVGVYLLLRLTLLPRARRQTLDAYAVVERLIVDARAAAQAMEKNAAAESERQSVAIVERRDSDVKRADDTFTQTTTELAAEKDRRLAEADDTYLPRLTAVTERRDQALSLLEAKHPQIVDERNARYKADVERLEADHARQVAEVREAHQREYDAMRAKWETGFARFTAGVEEIDLRLLHLYPDWSSPWPAEWKPAERVPPAVPFGRYEVNLAQLRGGISADEKLRPEKTRFQLPALLTFPHRLSMLMKATGEGRGTAAATLQAVMLRLLVGLPPGKVRFTIIDPVGLGENFSAFMHLADYDELLVTSRIWTESSHIEQKLVDLTEHMENVIQKYLRNEFPSIEEYNEFAGEVAEPYRILVVANFPVNFTEAAARRLVSIASSGPRCGVYTLISVDTKQPLPHHFQLADLEQHAVNLRWKDGRFLWRDPDFEKLPLTLDEPAPPERFTEIVRRAGEDAKKAQRVEVPFSYVAPKDDEWWTHDSRRELDVPLGRAGATKLQHMKLGRGTSQHALIAGKTGSGKSTFLHALVVNLALHYSPDEVEFYLIDFKKGVEFKTYATLELPHAKVIAIESEREFGLSVLERLDAELKRRGDLFRAQGVQDLAGYREALPDAKLPRVMLVVDEFQELFVEDDKLAQDSALLLDRLVRQGRAFGMHALLGSQTLGGAYSLARSTLGQMAVRIALQCSEADAHLILSEDNTAARLLTRPGEAIYNDANGLLEGNHPFQVVWLAESDREDYLRRIHELAKRRSYRTTPPIVFEGNQPADIGLNPLLRDLIGRDSWAEAPRASRAWLGAAVAIKEPTAAILRRQSGANMLIVGQQPDSALGILATSVASLAAQHPSYATNGDGRSTVRFFVLDGTTPDAPEANYWSDLAATLPHDIQVVRVRDTARVIAEIDEEVTRREGAASDDAPPWFVIVHDLGRFRDLRKADDDFGFSMGESKPASPGKQFGHILREGAALGIHVLVWCDTYNNVVRSIDRQGLRDFEIRVLFQMSGTDSSNLIDSPAAGKLGVHRALLYSEEEARVEKFRPYGAPTAEWLTWVQSQLAPRAAHAPSPIVPG